MSNRLLFAMEAQLIALGEQTLHHDPQLLGRCLGRSLGRDVESKYAVANPIRPRNLFLARKPVSPPDALAQSCVRQGNRPVLRGSQDDHDAIAARVART